MARLPNNGAFVRTIKGATHLECVFNNGHNDWDNRLMPDGSRKNYVIEAPGVYTIRSGNLQQEPNLKPDQYMEYAA